MGTEAAGFTIEQAVTIEEVQAQGEALLLPVDPPWAWTSSMVTACSMVKPAASVRRRLLMQPPHPRAAPMSWQRVRT